MKILALAPVALALAACGGATQARPEPIVVTKEVMIPVSAPCIPLTYDTKRPDYVDGDDRLRSAADAAERYQLLWGGRAQRMAREKENEAVIAGCPRGGVK
jgi:hypothetical protein